MHHIILQAQSCLFYCSHATLAQLRAFTHLLKNILIVACPFFLPSFINSFYCQNWKSNLCLTRNEIFGQSSTYAISHYQLVFVLSGLQITNVFSLMATKYLSDIHRPLSNPAWHPTLTAHIDVNNQRLYTSNFYNQKWACKHCCKFKKIPPKTRKNIQLC